MALMQIPGEQDIPARSRVKSYIPFILTQDDDYPDGINFFMHDRGVGKIDPSNLDKPHMRLKPLAQRTIEGIGYKLCDLLTWGESEEAHPDLGIIAWHEVKRWHIEGLYLDSMRRGYWSQRYWQTGVPHKLNPRSTIAPRLQEQLLCYQWMEKQGFISDFDCEPVSRVVRSAIRSANVNYASKATADDDPKEKSQFRRTRKKPGDGVLPSPEQILDFFAAVTPVTNRKAAMNMYEMGWRLDENQRNALLPGVVYSRDVSERNRDGCHYSWSGEPRLLKYSLSDDAMIGVLPDRALAFGNPSSLSMRIIGKGRKVRLCHARVGWIQSLWNFVDGPRRDVLQRNGISNANATAHLFIDTDGKPLKNEALSKAITRANDKLKPSVRITAHTCRHLHACYFLKHYIEARAAEAGIPVDQLTHEQIYQIAELPARTLQLHLGHEHFEDTETYIEMLIHSWLAPKFYGAWNEALDGLN